MKRLLEVALAVLVFMIVSCAGGAQSLQSATSACDARNAAHAEVYVPDATVVRVLGERAGRSGEHEGFLIRANGRTFKVEDNVDITGPIPLQRGDTVSLLGQLECDDYVIHWTHRDPRGRHMSGYIKVNGRLYE